MTHPKLTLSDAFPPVSYATWRAQVESDLAGAPFDKRLVTALEEGFGLAPLYTASDAPGEDATNLPGLAPFTRGAHPLGHAVGGWDVRQACDLADPDAARAAIAQDLDEGATSALLVCDASVRSGGALAPRGDGLVLAGPADLDLALAGVDLAHVPLALEAGAAAPLVAATLVAHADARGLSRAALSGDLGADPHAALAKDGLLPQGLERAYDELADLVRFAAAALPGVRALGADGGPWHDAGAHAAQELGWTLASAIATLRALAARGIAPTDAAPQLTFGLRASGRFLVDIAKFRAARRLWARALEALDVPEAARGMRLHVRTSDRMLSQRDPWTNLLRATVATFSAATGGADVITTAPFDRMIGPSDADARRMARNTQRVLLDESQLNRVVDPGGGSWALESLTDELARAAWAELQRVESQGGLPRALVLGHVAAALDGVAADRRAAIARRKVPVTGVSEFPNLGEARLERPRPDLAALTAASSARGPRHDAAAALAAVPAGGFAALVAAARAGATVRELALARWAGAEPTRAAALPLRRDAATFEALRDRSDAHLAATGARPRVFLASLGPVAVHIARANWIRALFEAGGFELPPNEGFADAASAAAAFAQSSARLAIICSSDAIYTELAAPVASALVTAGARKVMLAGRVAAELEASLRAAGVAGFVFLGQDVLATLTSELDAELAGGVQ